MNAHAKIDYANPPLVWRENGVGAKVRCVDPLWLEANPRPLGRPRKIPKSKDLRVLREIDKAMRPNMRGAVLELSHFPTCVEIKRKVAELHQVSVEDIEGPSRAKFRIVPARFHAIYETRRLTNLSMPQIGQRFGGRDHTTVLHALRAWPKFAAGLGIPCQPLVDGPAQIMVARLFDEMRERQITMKAMGDLSGVSEATIANWRHHSNPRLIDILACLKVVGLSLVFAEETA